MIEHSEIKVGMRVFVQPEESLVLLGDAFDFSQHKGSEKIPLVAFVKDVGTPEAVQVQFSATLPDFLIPTNQLYLGVDAYFVGDRIEFEKAGSKNTGILNSYNKKNKNMEILLLSTYDKIEIKSTEMDNIKITSAEGYLPFVADGQVINQGVVYETHMMSALLVLEDGTKKREPARLFTFPEYEDPADRIPSTEPLPFAVGDVVIYLPMGETNEPVVGSNGLVLMTGNIAKVYRISRTSVRVIPLGLDENASIPVKASCLQLA